MKTLLIALMAGLVALSFIGAAQAGMVYYGGYNYPNYYNYGAYANYYGGYFSAGYYNYPGYAYYPTYYPTYYYQTYYYPVYYAYYPTYYYPTSCYNCYWVNGYYTCGC